MSLSRRDLLESGSLLAIPASAAHRPPNIILMLGDDHRWDALGCMGHPVVNTPELDRLGREGVVFVNNFTTTPICCTSRASIMLGEYAGTHQIYDFAKPLTPAQVSRAYWTLMREAGYHTGLSASSAWAARCPRVRSMCGGAFRAKGFISRRGPTART
jgi:hypothetical protein